MQVLHLSRRRAGALLIPRSPLSFPVRFPRQPFRKSRHYLASEDSVAIKSQLCTLVFPEAPTSSHQDLSSFLDYADRIGLDQASTTFVGTHYEYAAAAALKTFGFRLRRVGGQSDFGIDLLGTWSVPSVAQRPLHVLLQCKAVKRPGPHLVRELEGTFAGAPAGWRGSGVLGLLVIERPATKGMRDALGRSRWPMGCVSCSRAGHVEQILWNRRAEEEGLEGMGVGTRYLAGAEGKQQLVLTFKGKHLTFGKDGVPKSEI